MTKIALDISEKFDTPVLLRITTRVCHSKSLVELEDRNEVPVKKYERKTDKYAMLPAVARKRHVIREELLEKAAEYGNDCPFNREEINGDAKIGIITSGISYQHAKEVFGEDASYLKLGLTYPLSEKLIKNFASKVETLYVVEENDPYLEDAVKAMGINCTGKEKIPKCNELNAQIVREALCETGKPHEYHSEVEAPGRAPTLCAGCPHRGFFYAISQNLKKIVPVGDIGCYALGINEPLNGFDYSICMGSGISSIIGLSKALERQGDSRKALGMVGDSTFFHSGLISLIDVVSSQANVIACILDNSITAMAGHQDNPGTAKNLMGEPSPVISIEALVRATGINDDHLRIVDPMDLKEMKAAIEAGIDSEGPFVIITKSPCALIKEVAKANSGKYCNIDSDKCIGCKQCMTIACPAIAFDNGKAVIADPASCTGCGLCMQMCKFNAIERIGD
jgi:indolepyruvate ferredoxin oxidoreductase alpha subunit